MGRIILTKSDELAYLLSICRPGPRYKFLYFLRVLCDAVLVYHVTKVQELFSKQVTSLWMQLQACSSQGLEYALQTIQGLFKGFSRDYVIDIDEALVEGKDGFHQTCLLYTSPSPRD